ncbi:hypothetical protein Lal_00018913 [Lupinus albus]|nr:hypothetical protein Lal_00018913 [Lupinus albus]
MFIGMQFESKEATINAIKQFHIKNSVDYTVVESMLDRYVGQCKHFGVRCHWRIQASINAKHNLWEIRKISGTHTCVSTCISQDHTKLNSSFIASCIIPLVSEDPGILIKGLVKEVVTRFGYTVTYRKAWTAKQIAMSQIYGDWEASLNLDYEHFISPVYRLDNLLKVYGHEFQLIGNEEYWAPYSGPTFIPNPLMRRNRTRRPKTTRIHNEMEDSSSEQNKKCGWCMTECHNRKTCPFRNREIGQSSRHYIMY